MTLPVRNFPPLIVLLALPLFVIACDTAAPTATVVAPIPTAASGSGQLSQAIQPVSQGWIIQLSSLTKGDNHRLSFDVLGAQGWPVGTLTVAGKQGYEQQGKPDFISGITIVTGPPNTATGTPVLELTASQQDSSPGNSASAETAQAGRTYEKTTPEGWRVRVTVRVLTVDASPKLTDDTTGQLPVFSALDLDVEVTGTGAAPYLGLTADDVTRSRAAVENLRGPDLQLLDHGVVIREVTLRGPAANAGLKEGDVILALDGKRIDDFTPLSVLLSHYKAGDKAVLDVVRDGKPQQVVATLARRP